MNTYVFGTVMLYSNTVYIKLPDGYQHHFSGSFNEVVATLSDLGRQGWDVVACAPWSEYWLVWTLRRPLE